MDCLVFFICLDERGDQMNKPNDVLQQILLNQVSVPSDLFVKYKHLGLNEQDIMVIMQLQRFFSQGTEFPTPKEIAQYVTFSESQCMNVLRKLVQKGYLEINSYHNEFNQLTESYNLHPLWKKLMETNESEVEESEGSIFILFEQEFARALSPFEIEMINAWLDDDQFVPSLIKAALRESVLMSKLNFKYIDRILREWKKKGVTTVEQARESSQQFRKNTQKVTYQTEKNDRSIYYNWLEEGES